jgi:AraC-like DNA-binding protein
MFFSKKRLSSNILGIYMLNFFIQSFLFANFHIFKIEQLNPLFYLIISGVSLADWPLMFMYVKKMSEEEFVFRKRNLLHFLPAFLVFILQLVLFFTLSAENRELLFKPRELISEVEGLQNFLSVYYISILLLLIQVLVYSVAMLRKLIMHNRNILKQYSYKEKISLNWLFAFVILYLIYYSFEFSTYIFPSLEVSELTYFSIVSLHIFIVGIWGLRQKDIYASSRDWHIGERLQRIVKKDTPVSVEKKDKELETIIVSGQDKKQTLLSDSQKEELSRKITEVVIANKLYLNPELSLEDLAAKLFLHKNYVSYVINDVFKMNFYNYINRYRIEEAKKMLLDKSYDNLSIEGIAKSCGYKSRNVFYPVFKKFEGITPLEYKKKNQG